MPDVPRKPQSKLLNRVSVKRLVFLMLVVGVTYWFYDLISGFLMMLFWATVLAIIFRPVYLWIEKKLDGRAGLSASITTVLITLVVALPLAGITLAVVDQAAGLVARVQNGSLDPNILINWTESKLPIVREYAESYNVNFDNLRASVNSAVTQAGQFLGTQAFSITQNLLAIMAKFFLMLYFLWWFLRDGDKIVDLIMRAIPIGNRDERTLLNRFAKVSRATLKGTLIVAIVQGGLGGLMFWVVGIPGALFWGVIMTLLSLLPIGGSAIVWAPAAVVLFIQGHVGAAIGVLVFGGAAIGLVDNLLRPILVGRDTKLPDYLVLVATLGGISKFGLAGFVVGPVIASLFLSVWEMLMREFGQEVPSMDSEEDAFPENAEAIPAPKRSSRLIQPS